jgi:probable F420-dependent oxidoreductase
MEFALVLPTYSWEGLTTEEADRIGEIALQAEQLGYSSLWTAEHFVETPGLYGTSWLSPLTVLAYAAARTTTIKLGTGVLQAPLRNPVVLAKEIATLQILSHGRFLLGVGTGWDKHEFESIGIDIRERGRRTDQMLDALRVLLTTQGGSYHSEFFAFDDVTIEPRLGMPELWIAGGGKLPSELSPDKTYIAKPVLARILRADAWLARAAGNDEMVAGDIAAIRKYLDDNGRDPDSLHYSHFNFFHLSDATDRAGALAEQRPKVERVMGTHRSFEHLQQCYLLGTTEEIVERIQFLKSLGLESIVAAPLDYDPEQVQRFAAEVMPRI